MKKIILIATMAICISTQGFSQISFGLQVGGNLAFTNIKYPSGSGNSSSKVNTDPRFGVIGGLVSEFQLGPVSLRPELNFIQKGYNSSSSYFGGNVSTDNKTTLNYLELPVNVTFNVPSGASHLFVGVGPVFSLGLSGKAKAKGTVVGATGENTTDIKFDGEQNSAADDNFHLKRFDFGADILAGYKLESGFTVSLGYTFGISNILPDDKNGNSNNNSWRNSGLALKIGYMFGGANSMSTKSPSTTTQFLPL